MSRSPDDTSRKTHPTLRIRQFETHTQPIGLTELMDATTELIPEAFQRAFAAAQKVSIDHKKNAAHMVITGAAASASDAVALVQIQINMIAGISTVFGIDPSRSFVGTLVAAMAEMTEALGWPLTKTLGKQYVAVLAKLFEDSGGETPSQGDIAREFKIALARYQKQHRRSSGSAGGPR